MWSAKGGSVLVLSYADYDATNQSYYGEQKLHFLPADPAKADQSENRFKWHTACSAIRC